MYCTGCGARLGANAGFCTQCGKPVAQLIESTPQVETPQVETPQVETPQVETPQVETPQVETPQVETPQVETPQVETPQVETPQVETPQVETPQVETPQVETPQVETPQVETPQVETPQVETPPIIETAPSTAVTTVTAPKKPGLTLAIVAFVLVVVVGAAGGAYWYFIRPEAALTGDWASGGVQIHIDRVSLIGGISGTASLPEGSAPLSGQVFGRRVSLQATVPSMDGAAKTIAISGAFANNTIDGTMSLGSGSSPAVSSIVLTRAGQVAASPTPESSIAAQAIQSASPRPLLVTRTLGPKVAPKVAPAAHAAPAAVPPTEPRNTPTTAPVAIATHHEFAIVPTVPIRHSPKPSPPSTPGSAQPNAIASVSASIRPLHRWACALSGIGLDPTERQQIQTLLSQFEQTHANLPQDRGDVIALRRQIVQILSPVQRDAFQTSLNGRPCQANNP